MNRSLSRRRMISGALAGAPLAACHRRLADATKSAVSIVRASYRDDLFAHVRRLLLDHRVPVRGKRILLKPNLVEFDPHFVINTNPLVVEAALAAFRSLGAADVRIAEGPGHRRGTLDLAEAAGYFRIIPNFESLFTDLNLDDVSEIRLARPFSKLDSLYLPNTALACDLLVSLPKLKTHHWVGATLSMKNFFGLVPGGIYGWPKNILHWAGIPECIADLHALFPRHFAIVDAIDGMEGNGPIQGTRKSVGALVAGADLVAVDATCCRIMRIDPQKIAYLTTAGADCVPERNVRQLAEPIAAVQTTFALLPELAGLRLETAPTP